MSEHQIQECTKKLIALIDAVERIDRFNKRISKGVKE